MNYILHAYLLKKYFVLSQHFCQFLDFFSFLYLMLSVYCLWISHPIYELMSHCSRNFVAHQIPKSFVDFDVILCYDSTICYLWILVLSCERTTDHPSVNFVAQWTLCLVLDFDILHCWGWVVYCLRSSDPVPGNAACCLSLN